MAVGLSVNLASLTIEGVVGKRKRMLTDMLPGLQTDLHQQLAHEGLAKSDGVTFLVERMVARCEAGALSHADAWYNVDAQLEAALTELLATARGMGPRSGWVRAEVLAAVEPATRERYGFCAAAFTSEVAVALRGLENKDAGVRREAAAVLAKLEAGALVQHVRALVGKVEGEAALRDAADALDAAGEQLEAAQLMWAACSVPHSAAGEEAKRAWASLRQLNDAARDTAASRALERRVLNALMLGTDGRYVFGSAEYEAVLQRSAALAHRHSAHSGNKMEAVNAKVSLGMVQYVSACNLVGITDYPGPMTREMLAQSDAHCRAAAEHFANAAAMAPDAAVATVLMCFSVMGRMVDPRTQVLPEFSFDADFGEGGARLREIIER